MAKALARAVTENDGSIHVNSHVEKVIVEDGKASRVQLSDGKILRAKQAVVSNADPSLKNRWANRVFAAFSNGVIDEIALRVVIFSDITNFRSCSFRSSSSRFESSNN